MFRIAVALGLAVLSCTASADTRYDFSYSGFYTDSTFGQDPGFDPTLYLGGYFKGSDSNEDGVLQRSEVSEFAFTTSRDIPDYWMTQVAGPSVSPDCDCQLRRFEYTIGGELTFQASTSYLFMSETITDQSYSTEYLGAGYSWQRDPQTIVSISAVPEPTTYAMLLGGLALLGFAARRKG